MTSHPLGSIIAASIFALGSSAASAQTQDRKLNSPLVAAGDVQSFEVAPRPARPRRVRPSALGPSRLLDRRVAYLADAEVDAVVELYSVLDSGGPVVKLNGPMVPGGNVVDHYFSPDGRYVVHGADAIQNDVFELFSVPADGSSAPVKLNGPMAVGGDVGTVGLLDGKLAFAPDGSFVVYRADEETDDVWELFRVPLDGSAPPVKLSTPAVPSSDVYEFALSPDGTFVVYNASSPGSASGMFRVPSDGSSAPVQFSVGQPASFGLSQIVPSGTHVVFHAVVGGVRDLYRVPSDASVPGSLLTGTIPGNVVAIRFDAACQLATFLGPSSLYSVPVDGSSNPVLLSIGPVEVDHAISPDGTRAVYRSDFVTNDRFLLYGVPAAGGSSIELNGPMTAGGDVQSFSITADSAHVVYRADESVNNLLELYSVPIALGPVERRDARRRGRHPLRPRSRWQARRLRGRSGRRRGLRAVLEHGRWQPRLAPGERPARRRWRRGTSPARPAARSARTPPRPG